MKYLLTLIIMISFFVGCSKDGAKTSADFKVGSTLELADFKMSIPINWIEEKPTNPMRVVQYSFKDDPTIQMVGFYFGNQDQMIDANIQRWKNEYSKLDASDQMKMVDGKVIMFSANGTFKKKADMMSSDFQAMPDYMTLAAIVPSSQGPYYFKIVGPKATMEKASPDFHNFLNSYRKK